eukprot:CAMPEP_0114614994 /NCGR_PEP_ID=MMETSP0168-20121206/5938_1 /TAXON_ID=95228 ORGANISM="Vannella sp., Strain DIVA3 517/6/12" /NCGR_SAMPLE_ID=MMETSP0168 /ASSEMBLY_ACC=CAM_ASM_000044 /LENGTH=825 /DNA_ID=CAMNT_0001826055 /DNA_START=387 /DNA_END=2864 /DNA_ORIENTATION=+
MGKLHEAVKNKVVKDVKKLLNVESPNDRDKFYQTPLHIACGLSACEEIVKLLLKKKADVNVQDRNGWTPLHCCASHNNLNICELLLRVDGIDVGVLNKDGTSPLHYLVRSNPPEDQQQLYRTILDLYVEKRGDINSQSKHGEAALHQACLRGNLAAVKFLLANHANINMLNKIGETSLHYAVRAGQKEIVELLIQHGADVTIKSDEGTPLTISPTPEITAILQKADTAGSSKAQAAAAAPSAAADEEVKMYDPTEFKLKIKLVRATNLMPVGSNESANPFTQVSFGKDKKTSKVKANTLNPKWNETLLFDIEDISNPLKFSIYDQQEGATPTSEDLLGMVSVSLTDLDIDMSGNGSPLRGWYNLKKKPRKAGGKQMKIRVEISYILKSALDTSTGLTSSARLATDEEDGSVGGGSMEEESAEAPTLTSSGSIFGWKRGKCKQADCDCDAYQPESKRGGHCQNCGHWPAQHENLGKDEPQEPPAPSGGEAAAAAGGDSAAPVEKDSTPHTMTEVAKLFAQKHSGMLTHSWEVDSTELSFSRKLGEGTSAVVFCGVYRGQDVAIKVLKDKAEAKVLSEFKKEFEIMSALRSPHVVFFYGACMQPSMCMVLEFCHKGALYDVLNDMTEDITWDKVLKAAVDTTRGLACLHNWKPQIVHRDLKSLNLLVDANWAVKVSDFGTSRFTSGENADLSTLGKLRGTYAYCAPEVYFGKSFTTKADIFSLGVILWEMAFRCLNGAYEQPYAEYKQIVFDFQIIIQSAKMDKRPTIPSNCPEQYAALIRRCWDKDPDVRPDTPEVQELLRELEQTYADNKADWDARRKPAVPPSE